MVLRAQGIQALRSSKSPTWRNLNASISKMSVLQIDAINTVIRSHYMPLYSRLGPYDRRILNANVFESKKQTASVRTHFEYWGHECSILPIKLYPLFRWRMEEALNGQGLYKQLHILALNKPDYIKRLRHEIEQSGPFTCRELSTTARGKGMWQWSETKQALEYLFWTGQIASAGRRKFERLYDISERVIPALYINTVTPGKVESQLALIKIAAKALGVATESDLRDYFRIKATDARFCIDRLVEDKCLIPVQVENWKQTAYFSADITIPRTVNRSTLLTPFDPVIWHRQRTERLFNFNYRLEIYVPARKRKYGYYVMPFLVNDRLVARVDLKAERKCQQLVVKGVWPEADIEQHDIIIQLAQELIQLASWLNLTHVVVKQRNDLAKKLKSILTSEF